MSSRNSNVLPNNLAQLQNLIKRDPESYQEEFQQQWRHFHSNLELFKLDPSSPSDALADLVMFLSQVGGCYPDTVATFPDALRDALSQHYPTMDPSLRMAMIKSLMLLRNKQLVSPLQVLELFFTLLKSQDKLLRRVLYNHIVNDIKNINKKHRNNKVNTALQNFLFTALRDSHPIAVKMSLDIMIELYRRNIWNDARTVNVIVTACASKLTKVLVTGLKFFLGSDGEDDGKNDDSDGSESETDEVKARQLVTANQVTKKTTKKKRKLDKALAVLRKHKKKQKPVSFNFSALHLIHDPQGFAERLFSQVEHSRERFEVRLMMMSLTARLIGVHELLVLNYYPHLQRFLQPHQRDVTHLLVCAAQASHPLVPPDALEPMILTIANNFVSERNSTEVMAVGLNAIREVCARAPLAMTPDLLQDLVQYKTTKNKTVMMAARSLMQLFRNVDPTLLHKKDRGKPSEKSSLEDSSKEFGAVHAPSYVPGAELLHTEKKEASTVPAGAPGDEKTANPEEVEDEWQTDDEADEMEWQDDGKDDDDDSDGWVAVIHSEDEAAEEEEEEESDLATEKQKAESVSSTRILTEDDFKKIQQRSLAQEVDGGASRKRSRTTATATEHANRGNSEIVSLPQIENVCKKKKHDKETRLATVREGRDDKDQYKAKNKQKRQNEHASTTNKEKLKSKPFMMVSHSYKARHKTKRSFRDKQIALRDALVKREKAGKKR